MNILGRCGVILLVTLWVHTASGQVGPDMAGAILVENLPFTQQGIPVQLGTEETGQTGCNVNVPTINYKFEVFSSGTITITLSNPAGLSEPILFLVGTLNETDPTAATVYDNVSAAGAGCFDNDAGADGTRTATVNAGDIFHVFVANDGITDISFTGDAGLVALPSPDNPDMVSAILVENLPFTQQGVAVQLGTQETGQTGCNFNVPSVNYKFEVFSSGTITITLSNPAGGVSEPILFLVGTLNETDPTAATVYDNVSAAGGGCFENDSPNDGTRTATVNAGDIFHVFVANDGITDISFTGDAGLKEDDICLPIIPSTGTAAVICL